MKIGVQKNVYGLFQSLIVLSNSNIFVVLSTIYSAFRISKGTVHPLVLFVSFVSFFYFLSHLGSSFGYFGIELKIVVIGLILSVISLTGRVSVSTRKSNSIIIMFLFYTLCCLVTTFPIVFRFSDHTTLPLKLMSVYFGVCCLVLVALTQSRRHKLIGMVLVGLSGSGTAMVGLLVFVFLSLKARNFIPSVIIILLVLAAFVFNQLSRGRLDGDWLSVDRLVILVTSTQFMYQTFSPNQWIFGAGLSSSLPESYYYIVSLLNETVSGYLLSEGKGTGSGRNFHNEHLRLIFHVGIVGWIFIWFALYQVLKNTKLFMPFFAMSFFGSIPLISSVFILLLVFVTRVRKDPKVINNVYPKK